MFYRRFGILLGLRSVLLRIRRIGLGIILVFFRGGGFSLFLQSWGFGKGGFCKEKQFAFELGEENKALGGRC